MKNRGLENDEIDFPILCPECNSVLRNMNLKLIILS